uniref:Protein kinase domain-containing protein n=1 Tax=Anopheles atroparvus TaxID=41427 RepID=A0AAG5DYP2_ANOAO
METPLKRSVLDNLKNLEASNDDDLLSAAKNPANCDAETSVVEIPPTPLLRTLGIGTGVHVMCIKRNHPANATRSPWAIKMLSGRADPANKAIFDDRLLEEAKLLRNLSHPNIVGYRAFDALEAGRNFLALEYCSTSLGNILEERYEKRAGPLEAAKAKKMAVHVLRGMDYLHTVAHILHGDMKSFNILINKDFESAKICDFGVSLQLNGDGFLDLQKNPDARYVGTGIWSAPEVLEDEPALVSVKADIFSFGLVIYETITLMPPHTFPGIKDESIVNSAGYALLRAKVDNPDAKRRLELSGVIEISDEPEVDPVEDIPAGAGRATKRKIDACLDGMRKKLKASETPDAEAVPDEEGDAAGIAAEEGTADEQPLLDTADEPEPDSSTEAKPNDAAVDGSILIEDDAPSVNIPPVPDRDADIADDDQEVITISSHSSSISEDYEYQEYPIDLEEEDESVNNDVDDEQWDDDDDDDEDNDDNDDNDDYDDDGFGMEDAEDEEEEDEDDGPYLNYGVLGSRPPIPSDIPIDAEHLPLVEMFHICTDASPTQRPTARQLLDALLKSMGGDVDGPAEPKPAEDEKQGEKTAATDEAAPTDQSGKEDPTNTTPPSE